MSGLELDYKLKYSNFIGVAPYNSLQTPTGPISVGTLVSSKLDQTHNQLFNKAIMSYATEQQLNIEEYKIIDNKREVFFEPSEAILIHKIKDNGEIFNEIIKIDFADEAYQKHWDNSYVVKTMFLSPEVKVIKNDSDELDLSFEDVKNATIKDAQIIAWDFARGIATLHSKSRNVTFRVDYKYINGSTALSDEVLLKYNFRT